LHNKNKTKIQAVHEKAARSALSGRAVLHAFLTTAIPDMAILSAR